MSNSVHYVRKQINTKSLLGRPALIEMLQEKDRPNEKSPREGSAERQTMVDRPGQKGFSFNNNIYNNYNPDHLIAIVSPTRRLLPKMDQARIDMIRRLQRSGKIKSTGRSPVPLQLYDTKDPVDHLYIRSVTKHVPVAHDSQLQRDSKTTRNSQQKVMSTSQATRFYSSDQQSKLGGRDSLLSPKLLAQQELQQILDKGYTIAEKRDGQKASIEPGVQSSIDDFRKHDKSAHRMVGEVSVTLPPGFGLKKPSKALSRKNQSQFAQDNLVTENTIAQTSMDQQPTTVGFISGSTMPNQPVDSLFQDQSYDHSLFDPLAFSMNSPQAQHGFSMQHHQQEQNQADLNQSQRLPATQPFRSVVSPKTHQEIADLLRLAKPAVYEEHRRKKVERESERKCSNSRMFQERRDTIQQALQHNTWHAPVKKQQILQSVLDGSDEPLDGEVDMAIIAHNIRKFGAERSLLSDQNEAQRDENRRNGAGSPRKLREQQIEFLRMQEVTLHGSDQTQSKSELDLTNHQNEKMTSGMINIQSLLKQNQSSMSNSVGTQENQHQSKSNLHQHLTSDQHVPSSDRLDLSADVQDSSMHESPAGTKMRSSKAGGVSAVANMLLKQKLEVKVRNDLADSLVQKTIESASQQNDKKHAINNARSSPGGLSNEEGRVLPSIFKSKIDSAANLSTELPGKLKPTLLAKRREKRANLNKHSMSYIGSQQNPSSKMSTTMNGVAATMSITRSGIQAKSQVEEDAVENVERIMAMMSQLRHIEEKRNRPREQTKETEESMPILKQSKGVKGARMSSPILDIPVSGRFASTQKSTRGTEKKKTTKLKSPRRSQAQQQPKSTQAQSAEGQRRKLPKRKQSMEYRQLTAEEVEAVFNPPKPDYVQQTLRQMQQDRPISPNTQGAQLQRRREMEQIQEVVDKNNNLIRDLLVKLAQTLQRPDSEQRTLRNTVLMPHNLNKYNLRRFVSKTIQLNVGQLYQPLRFKFDGFSGDFKVYFSHKVKQPNEENGYDQMATRQGQVAFPIAQENLQPNMLRYPKNRILYITMESDADCSPSVSVQHNKKEVAEIAVNSVSQSQKGSQIIDIPRRGSQDTLFSETESDGRNLNSAGQSSSGPQPAVMTEEELQEQAEITLETLALMLGSDENTQHAAKLNQLVKKKISYMINEDLDVAKDFLNLVEILKQNKMQLKKVIRDSILTDKHSQPRLDPLGTSQQILYQNQKQLLSSPTSEVIPDIIGESATDLAESGPVQVSDIFSTDLYKLYREGHLSKLQYNEIRQEQQKQKKKEIDAANRVKSLQAITKKEYRKDLQEKIVTAINKQAEDNEFVRSWYQAIMLHRVCAKLAEGQKKKKQEVAFLSKVFWTVVKIKINLSIKLKRCGPSPEERLRRQMRGAFGTISSCVHYREMTAGKKMLETLRWLKTLGDLKKCIKDTNFQVREIQERFRAYWQVRMAQIEMIVCLMNRERERLLVAMIKEPDHSLRWVGTLATKLTDASIRKVATAYYQACQFNYEPIFFAWRKKVQELRDGGYDDMTGGWHMPFMQQRGIKSMEEVNYSLTYKRLSLQKYLERASKNTCSRFQYFMNVDEEDLSFANDGESHTASNRTRRGRASTLTSRRSQSKTRRQNPNVATLEDAIAKQEQRFEGHIITDLKNAAYYPLRPAMKFIPTAKMTHQLIHQAIMIQNKNIEAPNTWREQYDPVPLPSSQGSSSNAKTGHSRTSQPFKVITEHSRLYSNAQNVIEINEAAISETPDGQNMISHPDLMNHDQNIVSESMLLGDGQFHQPRRLPSRASLRHSGQGGDDDDETDQVNSEDDELKGARDTTPDPFIHNHDSLVDEAYQRQRTHVTAEDDDVVDLDEAMGSDEELEGGTSKKPAVNIMNAEDMKSELS